MLNSLAQQAPLLRTSQSVNQLMEKQQKHQLQQEINSKDQLAHEKVLYGPSSADMSEIWLLTNQIIHVFVQNSQSSWMESQ